MKMCKVIFLSIFIILSILILVLYNIPPQYIKWIVPLKLMAFPICILLFIGVIVGYFNDLSFGIILTIIWFINIPVWRGMINFSIDSSRKDKDLKIISWNADGFQRNIEVLKEAAEFIKAEDPDIICFQERPHTNVLSWDSIKYYFKEYPYSIKNSREDEILNLAVFSKFPLSLKSEYYFKESHNKGLNCEVEVNDKKISLFNIHLQTTGITGSRDKNIWKLLMTNSIVRSKQVEVIIKDIKEQKIPIMVCGDFNSTPCSYTYKCFNSILTDNFKESGNGWGGSWQTKYGALVKIDYIFSSKDFKSIEYKLISNLWSDHKMQLERTYLKF